MRSGKQDLTRGRTRSDAGAGEGLRASCRLFASAWRRLCAHALRRFCVCALVCLLPAAGAAYTLIMRDGHRVEVPDSFHLTQTTLTYEAAPGIYVTVQVSQLDIAATERANRESPGSLMRRVGAQRETANKPPPVASAASAARTTPARTLTNRELERLRRARVESERAYEQRRRELGLPAPVAESRDAADEARRLREFARRRAAADAEAESYWRARATVLREEAAALDAQIDYLRGRLGANAALRTSVPLAVISTFNPFFAPRPFPFQSPGSNTVITRGSKLGSGIAVSGGVLRGRVTFNEQRTFSTFRQRSFGGPFVFAPGAVFAVPFDYANADVVALRLRLIELETARAGLAARWDELEDEARQAGALPGWLRE